MIKHVHFYNYINIAEWYTHLSLIIISVHCHGYSCPFILIEGSLVAFYENKNTGNCGQIVYSRTRFCNVTICTVG